MKNLQVELAKRVMKSLKRHWMKTNPHARLVMKYFEEKYGELPRPDHMAIRSISGIGFGIDEANSLFSALGYRFGAYWPIPKLNIMACHFEPPTADLEKIFFSEIDLDAIEQNAPPEENFKEAKKKIKRGNYNVGNEIYWLCGEIYTILANHTSSSKKLLVEELARFFTVTTPSWITDIKTFSEISKKPYLQETAHVLAYGFIPNHFTFLMQDPTYKFVGYASMGTLSKEIESLGIKMQEHVEGTEDSILCQTSTKAYSSTFRTFEGTEFRKIKWPRSYIEFIKRGADLASPTGRYEGFLPDQAQVLFKMTAPK